MSLDNIVTHSRSDLVKNTWIPVEYSYYLTKNGWRSFHELAEGEEILVSDSNYNMYFKRVDNILYQEQDVLKVEHSFWNFLCGEHHKWSGYRRMTLKRNKERLHIYDHRETHNLSCEFHIRNSGTYVSKAVDETITIEECRLLGWVLSDGCVKWKHYSEKTSSVKGTKRGVTVVIVQNDNKYGKEVKDLLDSMGCLVNDYVRVGNKNVCRNYSIKPQWFREYWGKLGFCQSDKYSIDLVSFLLRQPVENIEAFMDSFQKADGHYSRQKTKVITQNEGNLSEAIILAGFLLGYNVSSGSKGYYQNRYGIYNKCLWYKLQNKPHQTTMKINTEVKCHDMCVQPFKDLHVVVRQGDTISLM